jgi:hypothetical protein
MLTTFQVNICREAFHTGDSVMLWVIFSILLGVWLLALVESFTLGGFIHLLLVIALTLALVQLMEKRRMV